jgi:hypothetical protein
MNFLGCKEIVSCEVVQSKQVILYVVVAEKETTTCLHPPLEIWKVPIIHGLGLPDFKSAVLLRRLPLSLVMGKVSFLLNIVGERVYCLYNVFSEAKGSHGLVFGSCLLTDDYLKDVVSKQMMAIGADGTTYVVTELVGNPNSLTFNRDSAADADTTMKKPLSLVIGKGGEITITAVGKDDSIVFSKSLDDGKTWSLPQKVYAEEKTGGQGEPAKVDNGSKVPLSKIEKDVKNDR